MFAIGAAILLTGIILVVIGRGVYFLIGALAYERENKIDRAE